MYAYNYIQKKKKKKKKKKEEEEKCLIFFHSLFLICLIVGFFFFFFFFFFLNYICNTYGNVNVLCLRTTVTCGQVSVKHSYDMYKPYTYVTPFHHLK